MKRKPLFIALGTAAIAALALVSTLVAFAVAGDDASAKTTLKFDIAENGTRFSPAGIFVHDDENGYPAFGDPFVTEGYIYPAGTLAQDADGNWNGVNEDGSPEFPDLVIGRWTCSGWHVGDGGNTVTGPWVVSTQVYDLGDAAGEESVVTHGYETPESFAIMRAITGGSGKYSNARGEMTQTFMGFNGALGVTLQVELEVK